VTHLTLRSTRTPPALPSALSLLPASSAPLIVSVQARPVSSFVRLPKAPMSNPFIILVSVSSAITGQGVSPQPLIPSAQVAVFSGTHAQSLVQYLFSPQSAMSKLVLTAPLNVELEAMLERLPIFLATRAPRIQQKLSHYYLQIACHVQNGERTIVINAFHESSLGHFPAWKSEPVVVDDGGDSYWRLHYTVRNGKFFGLQVNGEA